MRYSVTLSVLAPDDQAWDEESLRAQIYEELEQYGLNIECSTVYQEPQGCSVGQFSSRVCELGTKCCIVVHNPSICPNCEESDQLG